MDSTAVTRYITNASQNGFFRFVFVFVDILVAYILISRRFQRLNFRCYIPAAHYYNILFLEMSGAIVSYECFDLGQKTACA